MKGINNLDGITIKGIENVRGKDMKGIIKYFGFSGYDNNLEPFYIVRTWKFNSNEDFKFAMEIINKNDILYIKFIDLWG